MRSRGRPSDAPFSLGAVVDDALSGLEVQHRANAAAWSAERFLSGRRRRCGPGQVGAAGAGDLARCGRRHRQLAIWCPDLWGRCARLRRCTRFDRPLASAALRAAAVQRSGWYGAGGCVHGHGSLQAAGSANCHPCDPHRAANAPNRTDKPVHSPLHVQAPSSWATAEAALDRRAAEGAASLQLLRVCGLAVGDGFESWRARPCPSVQVRR